MSNLPNFLSSSPLYSMPSTLKGVARNFDLFGQLDHYHTKDTEKEADEKAIRRDWFMVGRDLANALTKYGKPQTTARK